MPETTILDNLKQIEKIDRSNMLSFCTDAPKHYGKAAELANSVSLTYRKPKNIIVAGMGGSAISGELLKDWARNRTPIPIEICREYTLPAYANKDTLVFVTSYSGETEESLSVFLEATKRECMIICISSGGKLHEFATQLEIPHLLVPAGMAPRATLPYLFIPLPVFMEQLGLTSNVKEEVSEAVRILEQISTESSPRRPTKNNFCKTLASDILGTIPVVYGFGVYRAVAQRFKTQFNENSKIPAKWEFFPELNHNEIVGWEEVGKLSQCFSVILIRDKNEADTIRQRINVTKELMHKKSLELFEVWSKGKSMLAKMFSVICVGDFTSVYLAILRGIDPTPVKTISYLKKKLEQTGFKKKIVRELEKLV